MTYRDLCGAVLDKTSISIIFGFRRDRSREKQTAGDMLHIVTARGARPGRSTQVLVSTTKPNKRRMYPILVRQGQKMYI